MSIRNAEDDSHTLDSHVPFGEIEHDHLHGDRHSVELDGVSSVEDIKERFGFAKSDHINKREAVLLFRAAESHLRRQITKMTSMKRFDEARVQENLLASLRMDFESHTMEIEHREMEVQRNLFKKAAKHIQKTEADYHTHHTLEVERQCKEMEEEFAKNCKIKRDNLEHDIRHIPVPKIKYSKRLLELMQTERSLLKLKQYDDAKNVRRMIDRIQPGEEDKFYKGHKDRIQLKREVLNKRIFEDEDRLYQRISAQQWDGMRIRDKGAKLNQVRITNMRRDMDHAHHIVLQKQPEMNTEPSAHWQDRPSHQESSAHFRGRHLHDACKGKKKDQAVYVASLCDNHEFDAPLEGTMTIRD